MMQDLQGKRVAILVENGFEQVELTEPRKALEQAGAGPNWYRRLRAKSRGGITPNGVTSSR